jgi:lambda family phage portal protein
VSRNKFTHPPKNFIDRIVEYVAPERAKARMIARHQMALVGQWNAGRTDRRSTMNWIPFGGSADNDSAFDLRVIRGRTRDMQRNQPLALGATNTVVTSVAGTGLVMRSVIDHVTLGMSEDEAQAWQNNTERKFRSWAENPNECDAARTQDFYQQQSLALRSALDSGDVFASLPMVRRTGCVYQTKVQLIEADRVINEDYLPNTDTMVAGVVMDKYGAPVQYHILRRHPGGIMPMPLDWDIVPAFGTRTGRRNIVHLFDKLRPGQTRGVPYLAPVVDALKQLSDYTHAEITAAVVSSMFTVFVTSQNNGGLDSGDGSSPTAAQPGSNLQLAAGAVLDLAAGEDVKFADPNRPNTAFDPFVLAILRQVGVALQLPFEVLVKHFTSSYSAARAALLEAWRFYKNRRAWLAQQFCQPIYEAWLEEAIAIGDVEAPGFFDNPRMRAAYVGTEWIGDSPGQIDPQKEVDAQKGLLELNLTTHNDACVALTGGDWDSIVNRRAREEQKLADLGLQTVYAPLSNANVSTPAPAPTPKSPDDADKNEQDDPPDDDDSSDLEGA